MSSVTVDGAEIRYWTWGDGDGPALGVDGGDPGHAQPDPRAREDVGERHGDVYPY